MMSEKYVRITRTVNNKGKLIRPEDIKNHIKDDLDYYTSVCYYNETHLKQFQETGSVEGIKDVKTDKIYWDFDSHEENLEDAKNDALELLKRLQARKIDPNNVEVYFSGKKGFTVLLTINKEITSKQVKHLAVNVFGKDLKTLDVQIYNPSRILRVPGTKHQDSGLYKIPLTLNQLQGWTITAIKEAAAKNQPVGSFNYEKVVLDDEMFELEEVKKEIQETKTDSFNLRNRPKGWKASKWALVQGEMQRGERDTGSLIILATCRSLGYDLITAYYLAKGALKRAHEKYGEGSFTKEELWKKAQRVYSEEWQGGSFSVENEPVLQKVCERLNIKDESGKTLTMGANELFDKFLYYAENIDQLTIRTGIVPLDTKVRMTVGMSVGLIAPPGAGKTSIALQILHNMSKQGHQCIFFSYDMYDALIAQKIVQKHRNKSQEEVLELMKTQGVEFKKQLKDLMQTEYANVEFCFQNGQSIEDIEETIKYVQDKSGKPVRFIVLDYNELILTEYSDPTHSSLFVAQKVRQIAIEHGLCALSLFQPSKMSGDPSQEIVSYRAAKGSSAIEQSLSIILGMSRPGCTPELAEAGWDQFAVINCLKNRFGGLFKLELVWDPIQGTVRKLDGESFGKFCELEKLIKNKKDAKADEW